MSYALHESPYPTVQLAVCISLTELFLEHTDAIMFIGKTSDVGGEKEQKQHTAADDSAEGLKKKFHNLKVCKQRSCFHLQHDE